MRDDGIRYENYCCQYLQEKGYTTKTTVASGDQGADIIAQKDGIKIAVQCKYRTEGSVGNDAIQQALAGKAFYDCDLALVITNVDFTSKAKDAARKLKVKIWPNVRIKAKKNDSSNEADEYDVEEMEQESVGPFIFGVSSVFAELEEQIKYGNTLLNLRYRIPYPSFGEDEPFERIKNKYIIDFEEEYSKGRGLAQRFLVLLEQLSNYKFQIVDWYFSEKRDKRIFIYEANKKIINPNSFVSVRNELNRLFGVEIDLYCVSDYSVIISVVNRERNKSDNITELLGLINSYINQNITRSILDTDLNAPLLEYEELSDCRFLGEDIDSKDYDYFCLFNCSEHIEDDLLLSLEECARKYFKRKLLIRRKDSHRFVLCIKKYIGLNDFLSYINVHDYRGYDFSKFFLLSVGKCDDQIVFTAKLKNVDICRNIELINDNKSMATLVAYIELVRYFVLGLFDLTMIDQVKGKIIDLPGTIRYERFYSQGIEIQGIQVKAIDENNRVIFIDHADMRTVNCLSSFPIAFMRHESIVGRDSDSRGNIGLNAMMIQRFLQEQPEISELLGSYYVIDTLKKLISSYDTILHRFVPVFTKACLNIQNCKCDDENVHINVTGFCGHTFYRVRPEEIESFCKNEFDSSYQIDQNYYYWMIARSVKNRNLLWGNPEEYKECQINTEVKDAIEKVLVEKGIKYKFISNNYVNENYYCYEIHGKENIASIESQINKKINGFILAYKRESGKYIFVWDSYRGFYDDSAYLIFQELKKKKGGKPLPYWLLDLGIRPHCEFQSFYDEKVSFSSLRDCYALLAIRLKNVSIRNLETINNRGSSQSELLWGAWNELLFSLLSLIQISTTNNEANEDVILDEVIELYDSNNVLISRISNLGIRYSYLHLFTPVAKETWDGIFLMLGTKLESTVEKYLKDVVPVLNTSLQRSIKILEELSE